MHFFSKKAATAAVTNNQGKHSMDSGLIKPPAKTPASSSDEDGYPPKKTFLVIFAAMMLVQFLVSLDRLIIATAIPKITDQFNSLADVGWYASAYLLTMSAFQLLIGRFYTFYNPKTVYMCCVAIFELGSLLSGVAPNSPTFIVGRAIAGSGAAGVLSGNITLIVHLVPLEKRPAYTGLVGIVFAVSSVAGPLLGGVFTDKVSWRWCFYINLPIGALVMVVLLFVLKLPESVTKKEKLTMKEQLHKLDPIGTTVFIPSVVCLLLALQWGGVKYDWSDGRIIALLVLAGVLFLLFMYVEHRMQERATVPPRLLKYRCVTAGALYGFFSGGGMMTISYFLPIWFQAIKGVSAVKSGIMNLPAILGITMASVMAGILTRKLGYFTQWMYLACFLGSIGAGLITTFNVHTPHSQWIGYQFLWGFGLGLGMQQPSVGAQVSLPKKDVPTGASIMFFHQTLGGAVFVAVANNIFDNQLTQNLKKIPGVDASVVAHVGATDLRRMVPSQVLDQVVLAYSNAMRGAFYVGLAVTCMTVFGALLMEWKNLKKVAAQQKEEENAKRLSATASDTESVGAHATEESKVSGV